MKLWLPIKVKSDFKILNEKLNSPLFNKFSLINEILNTLSLIFIVLFVTLNVKYAVLSVSDLCNFLIKPLISIIWFPFKLNWLNVGSGVQARKISE